MPEIDLKQLPSYPKMLADVRADYKNFKPETPLDVINLPAERQTAINSIGAVLRFGEPFSTDIDMTDVQSGKVEYVVYLQSIPRL